MSGAYIPKLGEEEARLVIVRILLEAKKGQMTASELKECFPDYRKMGDEDQRPSDTRSGAPMFHQIVQNATDRMDNDVGIYRSTYTEIVSPPTGKILSITHEGREFALKYATFVNRQRAAGYPEHTLFDESALDITWSIVRQRLREAHVPMTKQKFTNCLKSRRYASFVRRDLENKDIFVKMANSISCTVKDHIASGRLSITEARPQSVDAWLHGRSEIDQYIDFLRFGVWPSD
ncbi:hypothetical protein [Mesorhizobium sp. LNHC229A00]|uniref:hypothetical protein n=1 Tax=Mesorhizobium sp. LNHC229A00 TaxID=1287240 RepID=UPI0012EC5265|nr:hypothetical protein [Mesorhizobium sp. LNHC229A00]